MDLPRLRWLPPALLLVVALHQLRLAHVDDLTPWCGGGFGMFSTNDGRGARRLRAAALSPGLQIELDLPVELAERAQAAAVLPTEERLAALARDLAPLADSAFEPPESIRIEVFATRFDAQTLAPSSTLLRVVEVPVHAP